MSAPYYRDDRVTLYHGDCLETTDWLAADVLVTDPPYGVGYVSNMNRNPRNAKLGRPIAADGTTEARDAALSAWNGPALVFGRWDGQRPLGAHTRLVPLMERLIQKCPPGVIADPFAGSGSTLVAARNLGRKAIGVEVEERYCELIARRLDQMCLDFEEGA